MNNYPPVTNRDSSAPWNERTDYPDKCPDCESELTLFDQGEYKGIDWIHLVCTNVDCCYKYSTEPDYEI